MKLLEKYKLTRKPNDNFAWWFYRKVMSHIPLYVRIKEKKAGEYKKKSKGKKYSDIVFYIIRPNGSSCGLMSLYTHVLRGLIYAESKGYVPIIDFCNYKNMYRLRRENAFENYFKQPSDCSLKDIQKAKNVIIGQLNYEPIEEKYSYLNIERLNYYSTKIPFNDVVAKYVEDEYQSLFKDTKGKVLGILGRGTDYMSLKPHKHAKVASIEQLLEKTSECIKLWDISYIYLATEDINIFNKFKEKYKEKLLVATQQRFNTNTKGKALSQIKKKRKKDAYYRGLEYLSVIYSLSKCNSIITSDVGGAWGAMILNNNKYDNRYIFELGYYE